MRSGRSSTARRGVLLLELAQPPRRFGAGPAAGVPIGEAGQLDLQPVASAGPEVQIDQAVGDRGLLPGSERMEASVEPGALGGRGVVPRPQLEVGQAEARFVIGWIRGEMVAV